MSTLASRRITRNRLAGSLAVLLLAAAAFLIAATPASVRAAVTATPGPTAKNASIWSEISFRGIRPERSGAISVRGSRSGSHGFAKKWHGDRRGFSLVLKRPLQPAESVRVRTGLSIYGASRGEYSFRTGNLALKRAGRVKPGARPRTGFKGYVTRPGLAPPRLKIELNRGRASELPLFIGSKDAGNVIYAADGEPIWFRPGRTTDFRRQYWNGKPVLTWVEIPTRGSGLTRNTYLIADTSYRIIRRITPGNGYPADTHEFRLTRRGTAYVTAYRSRIRDLRKLGRTSRSQVLDSIAQEIDLKTGRVIWEWHSLDHVPVTDTYAVKAKRPGSPLDYFHINTIIDTPDGNVMISGRSTNTIYKVSRRTGRVIWRLGRRHSTFRLGPNARFSWQHDSQPLSGNRISVFDNADSPVAAKPWRSQSRGLILKLDPRRKTARVEREFLNPARPLASTQGNVQALAGGNSLVGWGGQPLVSEYGSGGSMLFDARVLGIGTYYRAYRAGWHGDPQTRPAVVARRHGAKQIRLWISRNGDTETRKWRVFGGTVANRLKRIADRNRVGFETFTAVPVGRPFIRVEGLDSQGRPTGSSRVIHLK
ncbi:MAG: arylsulfotransferase family protein [Solirubrobacterales bacterium]|nr:arylsulfotransferase family protein [Solirubrobacterales bacterium]